MSDIMIEMLPANEGDCILISLVEESINILIDGGTAETYHNVLKPRLQQLNVVGQCIDLLIVTHIDDDHIGGILELLKENGTDSESNVIKIKDIWHNSYRHLQFERTKEIGTKEKRILNQYISAGAAHDELHMVDKRKGISVKQGTTLAALILKGGYQWNRQFEGNAICSEDDNIIRIGKVCMLTILTPNRQALMSLAKMWKNELKSKRFGFQFSDDELFDDAYEYYMKYLAKFEETGSKKISENKQIEELDTLLKLENTRDPSKTNNASISVLLQYRGRKLLFLADAIADDAVERLGDNRKVDLIKLPHHGSNRNITTKFINDVETDRYLVSTNSKKYNHPDMDVLAKIICKKTDYIKKVYFNYTLEKLNTLLKLIDNLSGIDFIILKKNQGITLSCQTENEGEII